MSKFFVRIELHPHPHSHLSYAAVHADMEAAGFVRYIQVSTGKKKLPTAEYLCDGITADETTSQVVDRVRAALAREKRETKNKFEERIVVLKIASEEDAWGCCSGLDDFSEK